MNNEIKRVQLPRISPADITLRNLERQLDHHTDEVRRIKYRIEKLINEQ
jgi:hypothetical protein